MTSLVLLILFLVFIALGVPISMSMGLSTAIALLVGGHAEFFFVLPQQMVEGVDHAALLAIPFFILAGNLMNASGMTDKIFDFATAVIGHVRGGLAQVNVLASMVFAGVSGAAVADCAGLGTVEIKAMSERGYNRAFAAAITAASSAVGPIIPPSIPLVIYAYIAGESVGRMFLGGMIPGIIIGGSLMLTNYILSYKHDFPRMEKADMRTILRTGLDGIVAFIAPAIILGSILTGVVTATESGVLASIYAMIVGVIYRGLTWKKMWDALYDTMIMTAVIMFIIGFATAMGWLFAFEQIPQKVAEVMFSITDNKYVFLLLLAIFFLAIGTVLEGIPALLISLPLLLPLVDQFGVDRVHFGLIIVYGLLIGIVTPPMGIALYIMVEVANVTFEDVVVAVMPFLIPLIAVLLLITFIPEVTTFMPDLLMGKAGTMKIGLAQMNTQDDKQANLAMADDLIDRLADQGADLIVLPEYFNWMGAEQDKPGQGEPIDGPSVNFIREKAVRHKRHIHLGSFLEKKDSKFYNTSVVFNPAGETIAVYRKFHLFDVETPDGIVYKESKLITPGTKQTTVEIQGITFGLSICYDLRFPEHYRRLVQSGSQVILVPAAFTLQTGRDHWEVLLRARALENLCWLFAIGQYGPHPPHFNCFGRSMAINPWGLVVAQAPDGVNTLLAEIDLDYMEQVRASIPALDHIRKDIFTL